MASRSGHKIRLVKCPKCLKILQEDEDVPVYQCGACSTILQAKRRSIASISAPTAGETEGSSSGLETILPSSPVRSLGQEDDEKAQDGSIESIEKQLGVLELSNGDETNEIQQQERSLGDSEKNEREDNSRLVNTVPEALGSGTSSGSLSVDHNVAAGASNSSGNAEISTDTSPVEDKQNQNDYLANKTSFAYDGSESSCGEREDQFLENQQWKALQKIGSGKFELPIYHGNYKDEGASSSSTFSQKRRNGVTTNSEWHPNRSLQLDAPGGRLGRQGRRPMTEQLRPDLPVHLREPYTRVSPSYLSHNELDRYSRAHSLQMPPYAGGMNHDSVDYMFNNNTRARGRGQGSRFSGNQGGWYSGQLHDPYSSYSASPQRPMEQPEYYPRWSHEIVSDVEDYQRNRHGGHHQELQNRRLKERQGVAKRHVRPTAGGAPFITCYICSENLQIPVDFLIFKKKHHLLRCGTCTTVLSFSLESRTHLVPEVTHDINANRNSNSTSESTGGDKTPSKYVQDEKLPVARGSPLHRLMGYSTVSQVFKASQRPPSV